MEKFDIIFIRQKHKAYIKGIEEGQKQTAKDIFQIFYDIASTDPEKTITLDIDLIKELAKVYNVELEEIKKE